jgi:hypothetical protein
MFKSGLTYCEGCVLCQLNDLVTHVDHAWCVTGDGKVVDVTFKNSGLSYFGVVLTMKELATVTTFPALDELVDLELARE